MKLNQLIQESAYDHQVTNKMHSSDITAASVSQSFTHKMAAKTEWHTCRYEETKLRHCQPRSSTGRRKGCKCPAPWVLREKFKVIDNFGSRSRRLQFAITVSQKLDSFAGHLRSYLLSHNTEIQQRCR